MPVEPRQKTLVRQFSTLLTERQGHRLRPIIGGFENQRRRLAEEAPECIEFIEGAVAMTRKLRLGAQIEGEARIEGAKRPRIEGEA